MMLDVANNAKKNIAFGFINKLIVVVCPFLTRTAINYFLGKEYLGLGSLFSSILTVLNLSELGLSEAIVYSMYKPVANGDTATVNGLLNFYRRMYKYIGAFMLVVGICLIPFLPKLISGYCPQDINLIMLYLIYLINTCLSYFMYAYSTSLIVVYQRSDLTSKINIVMTLGLTVLQIFCITYFRNYIFFALLMPVFTILNNLRVHFVVKKMFPQYKCEGNVSPELHDSLRKKIGGTVITRLCGVSRNSFDNITVSAFMGLAVTAMYGNYYYIVAAVYSFMSIITTSLVGGVGNHVVTRDSDTNYYEMKKIDFLYMWMSGWCSICILCLMQPFMKAWMGRNMLLPFPIVILLAIYFYLERTIDTRGMYVSVSGLWDKLKLQSLVEAIMNIILNIFLGKLFGLYGVIIATILTIFFINVFWKAKITFKNLFDQKHRFDYYIYHLKYTFVTVANAIVTLVICCLINVDNTIFTIGYRFLCCLIIPNILYYIIYRRLPYFHDAVRMVVGINFHSRKNGDKR